MASEEKRELIVIFNLLNYLFTYNAKNKRVLIEIKRNHSHLLISNLRHCHNYVIDIDDRN